VAALKRPDESTTAFKRIWRRDETRSNAVAFMPVAQITSAFFDKLYEWLFGTLEAPVSRNAP
jgi:hypothetical protein